MVKIKPRFSTPGVSRYVIKDNKTGDICYRVPPQCVCWPQSFRERVVGAWNGSGFLLEQQAEAYVRFMTLTPFTVQHVGVEFSVRLIHNHIPGRIFAETRLYADGHEAAINLYHPNPAVRSLMIYSYITGDYIGGMPKLKYVEDFK